MKKTSITLCLMMCAGLLAGCNSNTGGGTPAMAMMATSGSVSAGQNKPLLEALQEANQTLSRTPTADVPDSGSASYSGFAQIFADGTPLSIDGAAEVVGKAELEVAFAGSGGMSGTVTGFDDPTGTYTGTLNVSGGGISEANGGKQVTGDIAGQLTRSSGEEFDISGKLTGGFFGATGQYLNGADKITVTSDGTTVETDIFLNAAQ